MDTNRHLAGDVQHLESASKRLEERCLSMEGRLDDLAQERQLQDDRMRSLEGAMQQLCTQQRRADISIKELDGCVAQCENLNGAVKSLHDKVKRHQEVTIEIASAQTSKMDAQEEKTMTFLNRACDHLNELTADCETLKCTQKAYEAEFHDISKQLTVCHDETLRMADKDALASSIAALSSEYQDAMKAQDGLCEQKLKTLRDSSTLCADRITNIEETSVALSERVIQSEIQAKKQRDHAAGDALSEARQLIEEQSKTTTMTSANVNKLQAEFEDMKSQVETQSVSLTELVNTIRRKCDDVVAAHLEEKKLVEEQFALKEEQHESVVARMESQQKTEVDPLTKQVLALESSLGDMKTHLCSVEKVANQYSVNERGYATDKMVQDSVSRSADELETCYKKLVDAAVVTWKKKLDTFSQVTNDRARADKDHLEEEIRRGLTEQSERTRALHGAAETSARSTVARFEEMNVEIEKIKTAADALLYDAIEPLRRWKGDFSADMKVKMKSLDVVTHDVEDMARKMTDLDRSVKDAVARLSTLGNETETQKEKGFEMSRVGAQCIERFEDLEQIVTQIDTNLRAELEKVPTLSNISDISEEVARRRVGELEEHMISMRQRIAATATALENTCRERKEEMASGMSQLAQRVELAKENFGKQVENLFQSEFANQVFREMTDDQRHQLRILDSKLSKMVELLHKPDTRDARRQLLPLALGAKNNLPQPLKKPSHF